MAFSLRNNLFLKIISLLASIVLYVYVQGERNPIVNRGFIANIVQENVPPDMEIETPQQQVEVSITGPRQIVDRLTNANIRASVDLRNLTGSKPTNMLVSLKFKFTNLPPDQIRELTIEPAQKTLRVQAYPQQIREIAVRAEYPRDPPAGFRYGPAEINPARVKVSGRADLLDRIVRIIANASPSDTGGVIAGDFPISARDSDNKPVDNVQIEPDSVHVNVPLVVELPSKIVFVSPIVSEQPLAPYRLVSATPTPDRLKITARPGRIEQVSLLQTEDISARDLTETQNLTVNLMIPPDIEVRDLEGHPVKQVKVRLVIRKVTSPEAPATAPPTQTQPVNP